MKCKHNKLEFIKIVKGKPDYYYFFCKGCGTLVKRSQSDALRLI